MVWTIGKERRQTKLRKHRRLDQFEGTKEGDHASSMESILTKEREHLNSQTNWRGLYRRDKNFAKIGLKQLMNETSFKV